MSRHLRLQDLGRGRRGVDGQHPPADLQEGQRLPAVANPISIACPGTIPAASAAAMPFAYKGRGSRPIVDR